MSKCIRSIRYQTARSGLRRKHNAVGGNIGIFEGDGGDLRTGLAMQSLHNGHDWMHQV
ncbi:putative inorganic carbon transporter subunit DabA [Pseudoalteromonas rubra]|uniref:putative inorganic carbon transporter subunit DabA n=1 Tax=Pseudoalteromonas rubra TaxID=43658 RepID=UPI001F1683B9|nr:putative inorganic carbon transporter subunit DabA [Pseudoalteromonas rubra]